MADRTEDDGRGEPNVFDFLDSRSEMRGLSEGEAEAYRDLRGRVFDKREAMNVQDSAMLEPLGETDDVREQSDEELVDALESLARNFCLEAGFGYAPVNLAGLEIKRRLQNRSDADPEIEFRATECNDDPITAPLSEVQEHRSWPVCPTCNSITCREPIGEVPGLTTGSDADPSGEVAEILRKMREPVNVGKPMPENRGGGRAGHIYVRRDPQKRLGEDTWAVVMQGDGEGPYSDTTQLGLFWRKPLAEAFARRLRRTEDADADEEVER